ncbi:WD40 repeat domain-containing protein [Streptomyces sp. NPDC006197]|uniref:WD40 repeat domain-containing protein n=1 Tax=Streptomyces sp. NPDC006197 TaxID=3156685 RepID=UPI0033A3F70B
MGTAHYTDEFPDLLKVTRGLETVLATLRHLGVTPVDANSPVHEDPDRDTLCDLLQEAARAAPNVIVYYAGHGAKSDNGGFHLVLPQTTWQRLGTGLEASYLPQLFLRQTEGMREAEQPAVLLILDCCYSGSGGMELLRDALAGKGNDNVYVLTSAGATQEAYQGVFPAALAAALEHPLEVGPSTRWIPVDTVRRAINKAYPAGKEVLQFGPARGFGSDPHFFPNPDYQEGVAGLTTADQQLAALKGAPDATAGLYLTGRTGRIAAAVDLIEWFTAPSHPQGPAVVTGHAGTGKSALLSLPVYLCDAAGRPERLGETPDPLVTRAAGLLPAGSSFVSCQARGLNADQLARAVSYALGWTDQTVAELLGGIRDPDRAAVLADRNITGLLIDSIDEALQMDVVVELLLQPLARRWKVAVGCRSNKVPSLGPVDLLIDLGAPGYRDPEALVDYVRNLLTASREPQVTTSYQSGTDAPGIAQDGCLAVAGEIARRATAVRGDTVAESFLVGQLMARSIRGKPRLDTTVPGWQDRLPADMGEAFDQDLEVIGERVPLVRSLLGALALSRGAGLPWENIWAPVAQAVADRRGLTGWGPISPSDVRWVLSHMGSFIIEDDGPGGRSVFRLLHRALAEHLRGPKNEEALDEAAVTQALLSTVAEDETGRTDWTTAHPYIRTYLAQHAAAAGKDAFARLVTDLDYLAVADRLTLSPAIIGLPDMDRRSARAAQVYERARPLLGSDVTANAAYLQEATLALNAEDVMRPSSLLRPRYRTRLTTVRPDMSRWTLTGPSGPVHAVAFGETHGRLLTAAAGDDGEIRIWNILTHTRLKKLPKKHKGKLNTLAFGVTRRKRLLLASAGSRFVRVWDPVRRSQIRAIPAHSGKVRAAAFGMTARGRLVLASAGDDGNICLWNPLSGRLIRSPLTSPTGSFHCLAFAKTPDGHLMLASGGDDGTVHLWDAERHELLRRFDGHRGRVVTVALHRDRDQLLVASGDAEGTVLVRHADSGALFLSPEAAAFRGEIRSVALCDDPDGGLLLLIADSRPVGAVQVLRLPEGTPACPPLTGHGRALRDIACTTATGEVLISSASEDGTVRVWQPAAAQASSPVAPHAGNAHCVALARDEEDRLLLAFGRDDGQVRLWYRTSRPETLGEHRSEVTAVGLGTGIGGRPLLASADSEGTVRLWDVTDRRQIAEVELEAAVRSLAVGAEDSRSKVVVGTETGGLWLWDWMDNSSAELPGHERAVLALSVGRETDGTFSVASADARGAARRWRRGAPPGELWTPGPGEEATVCALASGEDGRLLLATGDDQGVARVWDVRRGQALTERLAGKRAPTRCLALTAHGGVWMLAVAGGTTVHWWTPSSDTPHTLRRRARVRALAASGSTLAIADGEGVSVIEIDAEV